MICRGVWMRKDEIVFCLPGKGVRECVKGKGCFVYKVEE